VVVDAHDEVLQITGAAGDYLKFSPGGFTKNVFKLTSHNLANALRSALIRAQQKGDKFTYDNVRFKDGRKSHFVKIHVRPLTDKHGKPTGVRLIFIEKQMPPAPSAKASARHRRDTQTAHRIADLERDLSLTRESLQATVQDLETSNEEIQAANEELLAANEELQSTNEELQSVNEELHTVNVENQSRIEELSRLTNDINNLLATASVGILLIDPQLRVRRASRSALMLLELTEADIGVPIETVARIVHMHDLGALAERVMRTGQMEEREIERPGAGRWLLIRCVPYRNELSRTQGVLLTLIDLTERHLSEERFHAQDAMTQSVLDAMQANVAILDRDGKVVRLNKNWIEIAERTGSSDLPSFTAGANYFQICATPDASPVTTACLEGMRKVLRGELTHFTHDYPSDSATERRWFRVHVVPLHAPEQGLAVAHFNITPFKKAADLPSLSGRS
jgi:two-component system CheB/CheR fusion protein